MILQVHSNPGVENCKGYIYPFKMIGEWPGNKKIGLLYNPNMWPLYQKSEKLSSHSSHFTPASIRIDTFENCTSYELYVFLLRHGAIRSKFFDRSIAHKLVLNHRGGTHRTIDIPLCHSRKLSEAKRVGNQLDSGQAGMTWEPDKPEWHPSPSIPEATCFFPGSVTNAKRVFPKDTLAESAMSNTLHFEATLVLPRGA